MLNALPIDAVVPEILSQLRKSEHSRVIVEAPPGAGKTTRVPWALAEETKGVVLVTEPRRIAARLAATRVAQEQGKDLGKEVGYSVRGDDRTGPGTRLIYLTEGLLLRRLLSDPELRGVSTLVFDEVHEQGADLEVLLALSKRLQQRRPELRLVMMSATLDAVELARYFDGAPLVESRGRAFEVAITHADKPDDRPMEIQVRSSVRGFLQSPLGKEGDFLVFLPGVREIERCFEALSELPELEILKLHGDLPLEEQARAIAPGTRQRVILATNVAESSLTIPNVRTVIDTGLARVQKHDPWSGIASLELEEISQARVVQRSGRAGRTGPGQAHRLFTAGNLKARPAHDAPELTRQNLTETLLFLYAADISRTSVDFFHPPSEAQWEKAEAELELLGAVENGRLTKLGKPMSELPLPPRLSRFALAATDYGLRDEAADVAAILSERDILRPARPHQNGKRDLHTADSDLDDRLYRFHEIQRERLSKRCADELELDLGAVRRAVETAKQLRRLLPRVEHEALPANATQLLKKALFLGFPDRVAARRGDARSVLLMNGVEATLSEQSVIPKTPILLAFSVDAPSGRTRTPIVRLAMKLTADDILEFAPDRVEAKEEYFWVLDKERVDVEASLVYGKVALDRETRRATPCEEAARVLAKVLTQKGPAVYDPSGSLAALFVRLALLKTRGLAPDEESSLEPAQDSQRDALVQACLGSTSLEEVLRQDLAELVLSEFSPALRDALQRQTPVSVTLPGGLKVPVHYEQDRPPWIEARLQNFFGVKATPSILAGRVPLQIHLLAPNHRAVQVTSDLAGFWERHYAPLRKELMRKYPRHLWPEDGATAAPPTPGKIR